MYFLLTFWTSAVEVIELAHKSQRIAGVDESTYDTFGMCRAAIWATEGRDANTLRRALRELHFPVTETESKAEAKEWIKIPND